MTMPFDREDGTELDKYIDDVGGFGDEPEITKDNFDDTDTGGDDGDGKLDANDDPSVNDAAQGEITARDSDNAKGADKGKGKQPKEGDPATAKNQLRPLGDGLFADAKGNLVDNKGKLIAQGGFAARMVTTNRRLKSQLQEQTAQLKDIATRVGEYTALTRAQQAYGLNANDLGKAIDLAGRMKRGDVVGVAKDIVAMAAAQGYNVTDILGSDVGDSIELKSIKQMLDERLAPITRVEQDRTARTEAETRARANYNAFIRENEYAEVHANEIGKIAQRDGVTPQIAYNRLMEFALRNGFDPAMPIGPQIEAKATSQKPQRQSVPSVRQKPMPNGATTRTNGAGVTAAKQMADADDDWGSIIRQVEQQLGGLN